MRTIAGLSAAFFAWVSVLLAPTPAWANPPGTPATPEVRLSQRAYIWQRVWTPALRRSIADHADAFSAFDVLIAEITFTLSEPQIVMVQPDWSGLRSTQRAVGLVVRVGATRDKTRIGNAKALETVSATCAQALARARAAGLEPNELQIDFDAPAQELAAYTQWLHRLRRDLSPRRLVITALPAWLSRPEFPALTREIDAYVLQVHSLEPPTRGSRNLVLCDTARSREWIHQADTIGAPFRVALPTYGYRVGFGPDGRFVGLQAEGSERSWPAKTAFKTVMPDHFTLALLVHALDAEPPAHCEGLTWFRLPTEDDELAWRWPTLAAVMHGQIPSEHLALNVRAVGSGLFDLEVENDGSAPCAPAAFTLAWQGAMLLAADGVDGWQVQRIGPGRASLYLLNKDQDFVPLNPGEKRSAGWLRLSASVKIEVTSRLR